LNRRIGERRLKPRFEVVGGELWGRAETTASLVVRNVGLNGALAHGRTALPVDSTHLMTADIGGHLEQLRVRVTRCQPSAADAGGFDIGLEFVTISDQMRAFVEAWVNGEAGTAT